MTRPLQLGLIEGAPDKYVGPLLGSIVRGNNADLIAHLAPLYLTGTVLDTTYGQGKWWRRFRPADLVTHDLAIDGVDFRQLPYESSSFDAVCFDPPYIPQGGTSAQDAKSMRFREGFGLQKTITQRELDAMVTDGLEECLRVARRFVLVKATDYTNAKELHLGHVRVITEARRMGAYCQDLLILDPGRAGPGGSQISVQHRARRAHSYLLVFVPPKASTVPDRLPG